MAIVSSSGRAVSLSGTPMRMSLTARSKGSVISMPSIFSSGSRASVFGTARDLSRGLTSKQQIVTSKVGEVSAIRIGPAHNVTVNLDVSNIKPGFVWG